MTLTADDAARTFRERFGLAPWFLSCRAEGGAVVFAARTDAEGRHVAQQCPRWQGFPVEYRHDRR